MPRRIDVELTSKQPDGTWTWRVAGARQPRGVLDGELLYTGVKVGDVVRAEADFDIEGISVTAILPPKETREPEDRLEILAPARDEPLVRTNLVGGRREGRRDRDRDRADRADRGDRADRADRRRGPEGGRRAGDGRDRRPPSDRPRTDRKPSRDDTAPDRARAGEIKTVDGAETAGRPRDRHRRSEGAERRPPRAKPPSEPPRPKPKRLRPGRAHRKAVLEALPPEQLPVAEQVLQGGIPAVRQAIEKQNAEAVADGKPEIKAAPLMALAEELLPRLRTAEWRDRAEAALADVDELDLRDLRSVVVAADVAARDDETRQLASSLREALTRRVDEEQKTWLHDVTAAIDEGRVVRALRLSSRPPKAGTIFPRDVATRLADAAGASLTAEATADRWTAVLDAVAFSPVRRAVVPRSVPTPPGDDLLATIRRLAARVPDIASAFGVEPAPEPPPRPRGRRRPPAPPVSPAPTAVPPPEPPAPPAPPAPLPEASEPPPSDSD